MVLNSYDPYNSASPYRSNSYDTGQYGMTGSGTLASQQNAYTQSAPSSGNGGASGNYMTAFSDAANSWGPRRGGTNSGGYDTQSPNQWQLNNIGGYPVNNPSQWVLNSGPQPVNQGPSRPGVAGSIGQPTGQFPVYSQEPPYTPTASGRHPGAGFPQSPIDNGGFIGSGVNPASQYGSYTGPNVTPTANSGLGGITGDSPAPADAQWGPGQEKFVPGYGWTASPQEYASAQQQVMQQQAQTQTGTGPQQTGSLITNSSADPIQQTPTLSGSSPSGTYTPSNIPQPGATQFPTAPNGATSAPDLQSQLRQLLQPEFAQEQSDLNRQMLATAAQTGDINSGGFATTAGKQQARLSADQGQRLSDYLTQASEAQKNRQLQTYQIDTNSAIAQMNNETAVYGIRTNDDLQRYLNSQNNALAKYGIDKNDVLQRYIAIQQAHGQASAATSAFNAAALQAATQQAIAAMNNQTAQQNSQNQYNLGVLGINAENYRNDSNNILSYLNLLNNSAPQPPTPQIPGTIGYGP